VTVGAVSERSPTVNHDSTPAPSPKPEPTPTPTSTPSPTAVVDTGDSVVDRSATATPTRIPTPTSARDARAIATADAGAAQLRSRLEALLEPATPEEADEFPPDGTVEEAKEFMQTHPPPSDDPTTWTVDQREAFNVLAQDFGERHAEHHEEWHRVNGPGGTRGEGSGELFLQFHRDMMRQFEEETGVPPPYDWDPSSPIPTEFTDPDGPRLVSDADVFRPAWLTADGTGTPQGNADFGETVTIDGQTFGSLGDFENPDQLGRALGMSGYHASVHARIGGTMGGFDSPRDPAFYGWHGHIDKVIDEWLATENGQAWAEANPDSPLLAAPEAPPEHHH
jgi:hypothetical protein